MVGSIPRSMPSIGMNCKKTSESLSHLFAFRVSIRYGCSSSMNIVGVMFYFASKNCPRLVGIVGYHRTFI